MGRFVASQDRLLRHGQHAARAAGGVINLFVDARFVNVLFVGVDQAGYQPDHLTRGEVVPSFLVRLFVEAHDEVLEDVAHLDVVDLVRVQINVGHGLHDVEKPVAGIQLFDLIAELELVEDRPGGRGKAVDVGDKVGRDVLAIAK